MRGGAEWKPKLLGFVLREVIECAAPTGIERKDMFFPLETESLQAFCEVIGNQALPSGIMININRISKFKQLPCLSGWKTNIDSCTKRWTWKHEKHKHINLCTNTRTGRLWHWLSSSSSSTSQRQCSAGIGVQWPSVEGRAWTCPSHGWPKSPTPSSSSLSPTPLISAPPSSASLSSTPSLSASLSLRPPLSTSGRHHQLHWRWQLW